MAEMGAQVVQVESPNMPCQTRGNYGYSQDHRNTYSITLNTRTAKGKEVLEKLIAWADIWIESGRPGTYAKNGLSDEHMWKINRKLAIVHVSGYGQTGPDKNKAAYDVSGQAMGGYMYMNGTSPTSPPLKVNPYLSDYATAYNACICALSIMTNARITGEGDACDVSQASRSTTARTAARSSSAWSAPATRKRAIRSSACPRRATARTPTSPRA